MKNFYKTIVCLYFILCFLSPITLFSANQDNNTGSQDKIKVVDEKHTIEGDFFYLNIPEGGLLLTGSVIVKDAVTGEIYKEGQNYIAYNAHAPARQMAGGEESGFTNSIYVTMPPGDGKKIEPIPQEREILVSYEYMTKSQDKDTIAEKVLEKLQTNYSKITDLAANITETSKVGEQPPDITISQMVRKGKDKSKLISGDSTIITDGNVMTIKESGKEPVVINQEAYYMPGEMPEIDYHYRLAEFLTQHKVDVVDREPSKITVEAIPNSPEKGYSKLRLVIDVKRGIDLISETYGEDGKLMLKQEVLEYQDIGGVNIPTKYEETLYLDTGTIVTTAELSNIRLNQGVSDEEFK